MAIERRSTGATVSLRGTNKEGLPMIRGHAAVFNQWYTLHEDHELVIRERVKGTAFANALREKQDVRALFNHDPNLILGRTKAGTLRLVCDIRGLGYDIDPPDTRAGRDVVESIRRGDVSGSSFGFAVRANGQTITRRDDPETGKRVIERDLTDLDLFDVSPVTYPAYQGTDAGLRSRADVEALVTAERRRADMDRRYERLQRSAFNCGPLGRASSRPVALSANPRKPRRRH